MERESPLAAFGYALAFVSSLSLVAATVELFRDPNADMDWVKWRFITCPILLVLGILLMVRDPYVRKIGFRKLRLKTPGMTLVGWFAVLSSLSLVAAGFADRIRTSSQDGKLRFDQSDMWFTIIEGVMFLVGLALVIIGERSYTKRKALNKSTNNI